jgi:hypothetical protein
MEGALQQFPSHEAGQSNKTLVAKLIAASAEIQLIPKRGHNSFSNYSYATAEDILQAVRGPLAKHGLLVFSSIRERTSETITTAQGKPAFRERITMRFVVTDGESELHLDVPSEGQDTGDKAIFKALTGATKYALRALLQLPIGDDPEADSPEAPKPVQKPQPPLMVAPPTSAAPRPTGDVSMATERQVKAIHALASAVGIPESYLAEKILQPRFNVKEASELTRRQASELVDLLKREQARFGGPVATGG